jgi:hypothetical protein
VEEHSQRRGLGLPKEESRSSSMLSPILGTSGKPLLGHWVNTGCGAGSVESHALIMGKK